MNLLAHRLLINVVHHTCLLSTVVKTLLNFWVVEFRFQRLIHTISLLRYFKTPQRSTLRICAKVLCQYIIVKHQLSGEGPVHKGGDRLRWGSRTFFFIVITLLLFLPWLNRNVRTAGLSYWGWDLRLTRPKLHRFFKKPNCIFFPRISHELTEVQQIEAHFGTKMCQSIKDNPSLHAMF